MTLRVAHVIPSVARNQGGPSQVVLSLLPALSGVGVETQLFTTDKGLTREDTAPQSAAVVRQQRPRSLNYAPEIRPLLRGSLPSFDVVHVHGVYSYTTSVAFRAALECQTPVVLQPHGGLTRYHRHHSKLRKAAYAALVDRKTKKSVKLVWVNSGRERLHAQEVLPAHEFPYLTLPLGVSPDLFDIQGRKETWRPVQLLFLGRVTKKKRLDRLLCALAEAPLRELPVELAVAGAPDPDLGYDPVALTEALGLQQRVRFWGHVGPQQRRDLLAAADIFVLPSEDESFGVAAAEAMAAGLAVVVSPDVGLAADAMQADACAVAPNTQQAIARVLARLVSDPHQRSALAAAGRAYAREHFSWAAIADDLRIAYTDLSQQHS